MIEEYIKVLGEAIHHLSYLIELCKEVPSGEFEEESQYLLIEQEEFLDKLKKLTIEENIYTPT